MHSRTISDIRSSPKVFFVKVFRQKWCLSSKSVFRQKVSFVKKGVSKNVFRKKLFDEGNICRTTHLPYYLDIFCQMFFYRPRKMYPFRRYLESCLHIASIFNPQIKYPQELCQPHAHRTKIFLIFIKKYIYFSLPKKKKKSF